VFEHSRSQPPSWRRIHLAGTESSPPLFPPRTEPVWLYYIPDAGGSATCRVHLMPSDVFTPRRPAFVRISASIYPFKLALASHLALQPNFSSRRQYHSDTLIKTPRPSLYYTLTYIPHFIVFFSLLRYQSMLEDELDRFSKSVDIWIGYLVPQYLSCVVHAWTMRAACRGHLWGGCYYGYIVVGWELRKVHYT
jgi:hypothetical protein